MGTNFITFSAPGKVHLLGEHAVVYGKPALLSTINLRVHVTITANTSLANTSKAGFDSFEVKKIIEPIVKKYLKIKSIPPYQLTISSQLPLGSGLGSSAAISTSYLACLLTFLKVKWDLNLVNDLTYEAEKTFQGNPSGGDNSTVVYGGLIWFRKESPDLKIIQPLPFTIPAKLAKNFVFINTGKPKESTANMVQLVKQLYAKKPKLIREFLENQEKLVKELPTAIQDSNEKALIRIIKEGERNLESVGVVSKYAQEIIRKIEQIGGAAKISGGGGKTGPTGILLCYHPTPSKLLNIARSYNLDYFKTALGVEGLRQE